jgi:mRNA interferase MazF
MAYVPARGDVVEFNFDPQAGHEIAKRRPAIVLSPRAFNRVSKFALVCPVTSTTRGSNFEVPLSGCKKVAGFVLADQIKSLDWSQRDAKLIEKAPAAATTEVLEIVGALVDPKQNPQ